MLILIRPFSLSLSNILSLTVHLTMFTRTMEYLLTYGSTVTDKLCVCPVTTVNLTCVTVRHHAVGEVSAATTAAARRVRQKTSARQPGVPRRRQRSSTRRRRSPPAKSTTTAAGGTTAAAARSPCPGRWTAATAENGGPSSTKRCWRRRRPISRCLATLRQLRMTSQRPAPLPRRARQGSSSLLRLRSTILRRISLTTRWTLVTAGKKEPRK